MYNHCQINYSNNSSDFIWFILQPSLSFSLIPQLLFLLHFLPRLSFLGCIMFPSPSFLSSAVCFLLRHFPFYFLFRAFSCILASFILNTCPYHLILFLVSLSSKVLICKFLLIFVCYSVLSVFHCCTL